MDTPLNSLTEIADIKAVAQIAKKINALFTMDNYFCTPDLQKPLALGADVVIHLTTKYLDGQGRVVSDVIVGSKDFVMGKGQGISLCTCCWPNTVCIQCLDIPKGPGDFRASYEAKKSKCACFGSMVGNGWENSLVLSVYIHPGLQSHPQHALAKHQQKEGDAILSFTLKEKIKLRSNLLTKLSFARSLQTWAIHR